MRSQRGPFTLQEYRSTFINFYCPPGILDDLFPCPSVFCGPGTTSPIFLTNEPLEPLQTKGQLIRYTTEHYGIWNVLKNTNTAIFAVSLCLQNSRTSASKVQIWPEKEGFADVFLTHFDVEVVEVELQDVSGGVHRPLPLMILTRTQPLLNVLRTNKNRVTVELKINV